ncbi:MAG: hypothetical protein ACRDKE_05255, partial [Solirubrobacterales bacterium]
MKRLLTCSLFPFVLVASLLLAGTASAATPRATDLRRVYGMYGNYALTTRINTFEQRLVNLRTGKSHRVRSNEFLGYARVGPGTVAGYFTSNDGNSRELASAGISLAAKTLRTTPQSPSYPDTISEHLLSVDGSGNVIANIAPNPNSPNDFHVLRLARDGSQSELWRPADLSGAWARSSRGSQLLFTSADSNGAVEFQLVDANAKTSQSATRSFPASDLEIFALLPDSLIGATGYSARGGNGWAERFSPRTGITVRMTFPEPTAAKFCG